VYVKACVEKTKFDEISWDARPSFFANDVDMKSFSKNVKFFSKTTLPVLANSGLCVQTPLGVTIQLTVEEKERKLV
jgi:hypothetical protein